MQRHYNTAYLVDSNGEILSTYDKTYLLAFGEYLPFGETFPILYEWSPNSGHFTPGDSGTRTASLDITTRDQNVSVDVLGTGAIVGHFAHAANLDNITVIDINGDGQETVQLDAEDSHTHGAATLDIIEWRTENGTVLATGPTPSARSSPG